MKSLFFLFFGTVFHRGLAEFYCVFSRCERLNFDQFPGRDMIVLCAFCVVLGSAVSLPDASRAAIEVGDFPLRQLLAHRPGGKLAKVPSHLFQPLHGTTRIELQVDHVCAPLFQGWFGPLGVPSSRTGKRGTLLPSSWAWHATHKLRSGPSLNALKSPPCGGW